MKKEVKDVKTEVIVKIYPLVEMEILSYVSGGVRMVRFGSSGYKCLDCGKELNHWNIAVNRNNLRYHIEVKYPKMQLICFILNRFMAFFLNDPSNTISDPSAEE